ncbi:hypothetical protein WA026_021660 [Henosepilachna vigintioctopunctata]|uniref:Uncharacterized protein n=1 Tax=Henosepilachna vigintioctopunctata TaxID=420089 RepID=A0AAW1UB90_9CUCU
MSPVRDECRSELIPGNLDNVMIGLEQNIVNDDRQGIEIHNQEEESPEKGDYDETDLAELKMSFRGRKLTNPEDLNDYKVSSSYCLKTHSNPESNYQAVKDETLNYGNTKRKLLNQTVRKGRSKGKNESLQEIEMFNGLGYVLTPGGMRAQPSIRSVKGLRDGQLRGHRQRRRPSTGYDVLVRALKSEVAKISIAKVFDLGDEKPIPTISSEWNGIIETFAKNGESLKGKSYSCVKGFDKKLWFILWNNTGIWMIENGKFIPDSSTNKNLLNNHN